MSFSGSIGFRQSAPGGARGEWRFVAALGLAAVVATIGGSSAGLAADAPEGWMVVEYAHPDDWSCVASEPCVDCINTGDEGSELRVRRADGAVRTQTVAPGSRVRICAGGGA